MKSSKSGHKPAENVDIDLSISPQDRYDISKHLAAYSSKITKSYNLLRAGYYNHSSRIKKVWSLKTPEQRRKLLRRVRPSMPKSHRPDIGFYREHGCDDEEKNNEHRDYFLVPCINIDDLEQPDSLPLFMKNRAYIRPHEFAAADMRNSARWAFRGNHISTAKDFDRYAVSFNDLFAPKDYADLIDSKPVLGKTYKTSEGVHIAEIQDKILTFLHDCSQEILKETDSDSPEGTKPQKDTTSPDTTDHMDIARKRFENPYSKPQNPTWEGLIDVLLAQKQEVETHVLFLREDPASFQRTVFEYEDKFYTSEELTEKQRRARILGGVVEDVYSTFEYCSQLHAIASNVALLEKKCLANPTEKNTAMYENETKLFKGYLQYAQESEAIEMRLLLKVAPLSQVSPELEEKKKQLEWLLKGLSDPNKSADSIGTTEPTDSADLIDSTSLYRKIGLVDLMDAVDWLISHTPDLRDALSLPLANCIGRISTLAQCEEQLDQYIDQDALKSITEKVVTNRFFGWFNKSSKYKDLYKDFNDGMTEAGWPLGQRFTYPIDEEKTQENNEQLRSAEESLDLFWTQLDDMIARKRKSVQELSSWIFIRNADPPRRTAVWVEPPQAEPEEDQSATKVEESVAVEERVIEGPQVSVSSDEEQATEKQEQPVADEDAIEQQHVFTPQDVESAVADDRGIEEHQSSISRDEESEDHDQKQVVDEDEPATQPGEVEEPGSSRAPTRRRGKYTGPGPKIKKKTKGIPDPARASIPTPPEAPVQQKSAPQIEVDKDTFEIFQRFFGKTSEASRKGTFPYHLFIKAMVSLGFEYGTKPGSADSYRPTTFRGPSVSIHAPHPRSGSWVKDEVRGKIWQLRRCYGWTAETFIERQES